MTGSVADALVARVPPHSVEVEQNLLGCILLHPSSLDEVMGSVRPEDFYRPQHGKIYEAMVDMRERDIPIDALTLSKSLPPDFIEGLPSGRAYILDLQASVVTASNAKYYAELVRKYSILREAIWVGTMLTSDAYATQPEDVDGMIARALSSVMGLSLTNSHEAIPVGTVMEELLRQIGLGRGNYVSPPFVSFVQAEPGSVIVLAAGTSVGKTAMALEWADYFSGVLGVRCAFFEYEMSEVSLSKRLVSKYSGVSVQRMNEGLDKAELAKVQAAAEILSGRKLSIEAVSCDVHALFAKVRKQASMGAKVVFIDHLGLIPFDVPRGSSMTKAIGTEVTNKLKRLATELGIVVVLLAQLNREGQARTGKNPHPMLNDLRDSGEIEQDADIVVMLYRYSRDKDFGGWAKKCDDLDLDYSRGFDADIIHIGVTKNRNGATGGKYVAFVGEKFEYSELSRPFSVPPKESVAPVESKQEELLGEVA